MRGHEAHGPHGGRGRIVQTQQITRKRVLGGGRGGADEAEGEGEGESHGAGQQERCQRGTPPAPVGT